MTEDILDKISAKDAIRLQAAWRRATATPRCYRTGIHITKEGENTCASCGLLLDNTAEKTVYGDQRIIIAVTTGLALIRQEKEPRIAVAPGPSSAILATCTEPSEGLAGHMENLGWRRRPEYDDWWCVYV